MALTEKKNAGLMSMIKKMHSVVEYNDIDKQRQSQDNIGLLFGANKEVEYQDILIEGMKAEWVRVNRKHMKKYVVLYCHGGGYMTGSMKYARTITSKLATSAFMDVLSFDYRLAPENPFPAALEDAVKAWNYLMMIGYGAKDVLLAGDSAGGNLALALALRLKSESRIMPKGIFLLSPWTDLTMSGESHKLRGEVDPILDEKYISDAIQAYAALKDLNNPFISPLWGDFTGFPPTYIQVGDNEILYSDSEMLYKKMLKDNVSVKMDVFDGMWHVFQMSPFKTAYDAIEQGAEFFFGLCE